MSVPRKLDKTTGYVICAAGPLPYETEEDKKALQTLALILDEAIKKKHLIFVEGHIGYQSGEGITNAEKEAYKIINRHCIINLAGFKSSKKIDEIMSVARARQLNTVLEPQPGKKPFWKRLLGLD